MGFFDFHHHDAAKNLGIYNLKFNEIPPENYFSAGIHPDAVADDFEEKLNWLRDISAHKNCVAIGECGLDGLIDVDEKLQQKAFLAQIAIANSLQKPLIIHCVKRFQELIPFQKIAKIPLIIHGFNKKKSVADEMLKHGFYLSFGKSVLHNLSLQIIIRDFPIEKMFLETDNKDFDIAELYQKVAEIKEISLEKLQNQVSKNLENVLFK